MVDKNAIRAAFSARLHEALDDAEVRKRGRGVDVHNQLKELGVYKTPQAVSKWLNGESTPEADSIAMLSDWLNVRREWLEYGVLPKKPLHVVTATQEHLNKHSHSEPLLVPIIPLEEVFPFSKNIIEHKINTYEKIFCPIKIHSRGFAIIIHGDSMANPLTGKNYPDRAIVFIDPSQVIKSGDSVIALNQHNKKATFKIFIEDMGQKYLKPVNPQYPMIEIDIDTILYGKAICTVILENN